MYKGWVYLKKMTDHNGTPTAYCFGLTSKPEKRKRAYRKENPFIVHLEDFRTNNMRAAEEELITEAKRRRWLLRDNSNEWIKASCFDDFQIIWKRVKDKHSVQESRKRKAAKRKQRKTVDVMGDPTTQKEPYYPVLSEDELREIKKKDTRDKFLLVGFWAIVYCIYVWCASA